MGGTLVVSRRINNFNYYKKRFEELGFENVTVTGKDKDALNTLIRDMKPDLVIISANFYKCSTPYMVGELVRRFDDIKIAAVVVGFDYPADLGMYFVVNGAVGYVTSTDGLEQFYTGLEIIRKGGKYLSPSAQERINIRSEYPMPAGLITRRQLEVLRCVCNGFSDIETADNLGISERTVSNEKKILFTSLNLRNEKELIRVADYMNWVNFDQLVFYGRDYVLKPVPDINKKFKGKEILTSIKYEVSGYREKGKEKRETSKELVTGQRIIRGILC